MSADPNTVAGRLVERTILRGYATLLDELRQPIIDVPKMSSVAPRPAQPASFIFTSQWANFKQHKLDNREWKPDTAENAEGTKNIFDKFFPGITTAQFVSEPVASDFKSKLMLLPRNYARGNQKKMSPKTDRPRMEYVAYQRQSAASNGQQARHQSRRILVVSCHAKEDPRRHEDPFVGLHIPLKKGRKARNERHNWTPTLEKELFESPLYRGCASIHRRATPGSQIFRDALFWMPLLGRTMGTRENEICDALVGDIKLEETNGGPIWYLEIIDGKDLGSERRVPFADLVLGIGFLEQRVIGRDPDQPLFPELIPQGTGMRRSAAFTGRFAHYKLKTKIHRPRVDFHCSRQR